MNDSEYIYEITVLNGEKFKAIPVFDTNSKILYFKKGGVKIPYSCTRESKPLYQFPRSGIQFVVVYYYNQKPFSCTLRYNRRVNKFEYYCMLVDRFELTSISFLVNTDIVSIVYYSQDLKKDTTC